MDAMEKAYSKVKNKFTSNEFCAFARSYGARKTQIEQAPSFLRAKGCIQGPGKRTWAKPGSTIEVKQAPAYGDAYDDITEEQAIERLKKAGGYEIYKTDRVKIV